MEEITKTIFIYDSCGQEAISFFVLEGDYRKLNQIYVNCSEAVDLVDELGDLMYDSGDLKVDLLSEFPINSIDKNTAVIIVGFAIW